LSALAKSTAPVAETGRPLPRTELATPGLGPLGLALLAALPPLALLAAERFVFGAEWGFPLDDSWIHLVFARSLAAGQGLSFNPGELVAATTAPLWTALLGLAALLPGSSPLWTKLLGIACQAASAGVALGLARRLGFSPHRALLAAGLVAISDWLVWSAVSGMEVSLCVLLSLAGMARHLDERRQPESPPLAFVLLALAALARPEALLLPLAAALDRLLEFERRSDRLVLARARLAPVLLGLLAAALVIVPVGLAFHEIWGSPLPTTFTAKSSGPPVWVPQVRFLQGVLGLLFSAQPWFVLLALGGVVETLRRLGGPRDRGLLLPLWTLGMPLAAAALSSGREIAVGNFGRYFFPLLPMLVLLGLLALEPLAWDRWRFVEWRGVRLPVGVLGLALLVAPSLVGLAGAAGRYVASDVAVARWLASRLPSDALLAVNDVGAIKYLLPNRVLDLVGIVTPEVIAPRRAGAAAGRSHVEVLAEVLERARPDFVVVFPDWFPHPARQPERFRPLRVFAIPDNVAMGGDMMVIYDTPWTRRPLTPEEPAHP